MPALQVLGKLAMADIFLIALYIAISRGIGVGRIETAWGLYLFTFCILASLVISLLSERAWGADPVARRRGREPLEDARTNGS